MAVIFVFGQIADTATDGSTLVRVSVPNLNQLDRIVHEPMRWDVHVKPSGLTYFPVKGDSAIVATDTLSGEEWIASWRSKIIYSGAKTG